MNVVSFAKVVPYDGIPHAGGEYFRRHADSLVRSGHRLTVIAPRDGRNVAALSRRRADFEVVLVGPERRTLMARVADRIHAHLHPASMPPRFARGLRTDARAQTALQTADVIEVQWTEMMTVVPEEAVAGRPLLLVAHDVIEQRERRRLAATARYRLLSRWAARPRVRRAVTVEASSVARADLVLTFSDKDAEKLRAVAPATLVRPVAPPLWDSDEAQPVGSDVADGGPATVIMVAAFNRPENRRGAVWFLDHVWPLVVERHPDARFVAVGASPGRALEQRARRGHNVELSGYVESVVPYYAAADLAVIPLLTGAGVKFKTIDALLHGLPVVATSVGAEGVVDERGKHPFAVSDDAETFAGAVCEFLDDIPAATSAQRAVRDWARSRYGREAFDEALARVMAELSHASGEMSEGAGPRA